MSKKRDSALEAEVSKALTDEISEALTTLRIEHVRDPLPIRTIKGIARPKVYAPDLRLVIAVADNSSSSGAFSSLVSFIQNPTMKDRVSSLPEIYREDGQFGIEALFIAGQEYFFVENWRSRLSRAIYETNSMEEVPDFLARGDTAAFFGTQRSVAAFAVCRSCNRAFLCAYGGFKGCRYGCKDGDHKAITSTVDQLFIMQAFTGIPGIKPY